LKKKRRPGWRGRRGDSKRGSRGKRGQHGGQRVFLKAEAFLAELEVSGQLGGTASEAGKTDQPPRERRKNHRTGGKSGNEKSSAWSRLNLSEKDLNWTGTKGRTKDIQTAMSARCFGKGRKLGGRGACQEQTR